MGRDLRVQVHSRTIPLMVADSAEGPDTPRNIEALEREAVASYLSGADEASEELWTRAHTEWLRRGDIERAARCVFWLVLDLFNRGEWARGSGWLSRGFHLLDPPRNSASLALLSVLASRNHLKLGDLGAAENAVTTAFDAASELDDPELAIFSRLGLGLVKVQRGEFAEAVALFDEIMVGVTVDSVSPIAVGVVYCAGIDVCRSLFDLSRAREWTAALGRWCSAQPNLVAYRGKCLVHRSEIMRFSGDWSDALVEAKQACAWTDAHPNSFKYPVGAAFYELAELHRLRGNLPAAEAAYRRASENGRVPEPGLTLLRLAQGEAENAEAAIRRLLKEGQNEVVRVAVLQAAVEVLIAASDLEGAHSAADELARIAQRYETPALRALSRHATGAVFFAEGDIDSALTRLREAWTLWQELDAPYEAARVRLLLGQICQQLGDDAAAELEFDTALRVFRRLDAEPDVARVDTLRSQPAGKRAGALTSRELQVIELVAKGQTNRAIASELSISERTVDRHVSNILLKLNLPSRAAATAYAFQNHLI